MFPCSGPSTQACGNCGMQTRTCDMTTGTWSAWGACGGQGQCAAGVVGSCGAGGTHTCELNCTWTACTGQVGSSCSSTPECGPGLTCVGNVCCFSSSCPAVDQCHIGGVCSTSTGRCVAQNAIDGTSCTAGPHAISAACSSGICKITECDQGTVGVDIGPWLDCDGDASDGCEIQSIDSHNCGSCGNDCSLCRTRGTCPACNMDSCNCTPGTLSASNPNGTPNFCSSGG
jgi:hypothetical protein